MAVRYTKPLSETAQATRPPPRRESGIPLVPLRRRVRATMTSTIVPTTTSPIG